MRISDGAKAMNVKILPVNDMYEVVDVWTTENGHWYMTDSPYSVPEWAIDQYFIPNELGGSHHIYVRVLKHDGSVDEEASVMFRNDDIFLSRTIDAKNGFANLPVYNSFSPGNGENGGWKTAPVAPGGHKYLVEGGGLPNGNHVSLFAIFRPRGDSGNGNGSGDYMEISIPSNNTTVTVRTNGHEFKMEFLL